MCCASSERGNSDRDYEVVSSVCEPVAGEIKDNEISGGKLLAEGGQDFLPNLKWSANISVKFNVKTEFCQPYTHRFGIRNRAGN
jgi:hypothetical protein